MELYKIMSALFFFALMESRSKMYITKLTLSRPNQTERLFEKPELGRLGALAISTTNNQPVNVMCSNNNGNCSTFCLPIPQGRTCACEDDVALREDGKICSNVIITTETLTVIVPPPNVTTTSSRPTDQIWIFSAIGGSAGLVVLTIAVVLTICCYRRRTISKRREWGGSESIISSRDRGVPSHSIELISNRTEAQCDESNPVSTSDNIYFTIEETLDNYEYDYQTIDDTAAGEMNTNSRTQDRGPVHNHPAPKDDWKSQNAETLPGDVQNKSPIMVDIPEGQDSEYETPVTGAGNTYLELSGDVPTMETWGI